MDGYHETMASVEACIESIQDGIADPHHYPEEMDKYKDRLRWMLQFAVGNCVSFLTYKEILQAVHTGIEEYFCDQDEWDKWAGHAMSSLAE